MASQVLCARDHQIPRSHETYGLLGPIGLGWRMQAREKSARNDHHTMLRLDATVPIGPSLCPVYKICPLVEYAAFFYDSYGFCKVCMWATCCCSLQRY